MGGARGPPEEVLEKTKTTIITMSQEEIMKQGDDAEVTGDLSRVAQCL